MTALFRFFNFKKPRKATGHRSQPNPEAYSEALLSGWVPPLPERDAPAAPAQATAEDVGDRAALLERFYRNQQ